MDFVLEMSALDDPERYLFIRNGREVGRSQAPEAMARWTDVLKGTALLEYLAKIGVTAGNKAVAAWKARRGPGLRPGLSRGGKAIEDADNPG